MTTANTILGFYSPGITPEIRQRSENLLNPQHLPIERFAAYSENAEEEIRKVGSLYAWFQLTKPPLLFVISLSGRSDELMAFDPLFAKVHSITFVCFSKFNSNTEEYRAEYKRLEMTFLSLELSCFTEPRFAIYGELLNPSYASYPKELKFISFGADQNALNAEQQALLETACRVPKPLLTRLIGSLSFSK